MPKRGILSTLKSGEKILNKDIFLEFLSKVNLIDLDESEKGKLNEQISLESRIYINMHKTERSLKDRTTQYKNLIESIDKVYRNILPIKANPQFWDIIKLSDINIQHELKKEIHNSLSIILRQSEVVLDLSKDIKLPKPKRGRPVNILEDDHETNFILRLCSIFEKYKNDPSAKPSRNNQKDDKLGKLVAVDTSFTTFIKNVFLYYIGDKEITSNSESLKKAIHIYNHID
jgi:hypothetical protein